MIFKLFEYTKYYYNVNSSEMKIKPKDKYPHIDNNEYFEKRIKLNEKRT